MASDCRKCGAGFQPGVILCRYCRTPFDEEEARRATPCPGCRDLYAPTTQRCEPCQRWLVVQCVFCEGLSPYTRTACDGCGEVFAGAAARKAARDAQPTWPAGPPSSSGWVGAPGGSPSSGFEGWGEPAPAPTPDASELFAGFGRGGAAPAPAATPATGPSSWQFDDWTGTRRSR